MPQALLQALGYRSVSQPYTPTAVGEPLPRVASLQVVYKGWTKRTCPFAAKRPASPPPDDDCFVLPDFHAVAANHHNNTANAPSDKATSKAEEPA